MIGMRLYCDEPMKVIKLISDNAQKEYAIEMQTDQIEQEIKTIEF